MPLPSISDNGYLPAGVHRCSFEEAQNLFGFGVFRGPLWEKFIAFIEHIREVGIFSELILDGQYVSSQEEVYDIDVALRLMPKPSEGVEEWTEALRKYSDKQVRNELQEDYSVCMYIDAPNPFRKDYSEWLQNIPPEHAPEQDAPERARKGILLIEL